ncbi:hypothetical protein CBL_11481 [Carabus blaptoides fortunei]
MNFQSLQRVLVFFSMKHLKASKRSSTRKPQCCFFDETLPNEPPSASMSSTAKPHTEPTGQRKSPTIDHVAAIVSLSSPIVFNPAITCQAHTPKRSQTLTNSTSTPMPFSIKHCQASNQSAKQNPQCCFFEEPLLHEAPTIEHPSAAKSIQKHQRALPNVQ